LRAGRPHGAGRRRAVHETPAIWAPNVKQATVTLAARKSVKSIALSGGIWMDADASNDGWVPK